MKSFNGYRCTKQFLNVWYFLLYKTKPAFLYIKLLRRVTALNTNRKLSLMKLPDEYKYTKQFLKMRYLCQKAAQSYAPLN